MNEITRNLPIDEQLAILKRGVVDLVSEADLKERLARGTPLRVKLGADPTRPDLHLGHAVILRKMRQFQDLGHKVIMLIGDFTATIGDPTGKSKTRPPLTLEEARANAESYLEQCRIILRQESEVLEVRYNSEWLEKLGYKDIIQLASRYTVARIMERDDFRKRFEGGVPISMHELLYPLTQGYDSVALEADVELGGTDQLFNNLVGRALQRDYDQEGQIVMTLPLLVGLDGTEKMSKSLDNYIGLTDSSEVMYAKLMKIPDTLLENYFILLTDMKSDEVKYIIDKSKILAHQVLGALLVDWIHNKNKPDLTNLKKFAPELHYEVFKSPVSTSIDEYNILLDHIFTALENLNSLHHKISALLDIIGNERMKNGDEAVIKASNNLSLMRDSIDKANKSAKTLEEARLKLGESFPLEQAISEMKVFFEGIVDSKVLLESDKIFQQLLGYFRELFERDLAQTSSINSAKIFNDSSARYRDVARGGIPENIPAASLPKRELNEDGTVAAARLVALSGLEPSNGAARKLIQNRGLKVDGETYNDPQGILHIPPAGLVLQKGKDRFVRVVLEG